MSYRPEVDHRCSHERCREKGEYRLRASCGNCKSAYVALLTKGHDRPLFCDCPYCGSSHVIWGGLA